MKSVGGMLARSAIGSVLVIYPFVVYFGLQSFGLKWTAFLVIVLVAARLALIGMKGTRIALLASGGTIVLAAFALMSNDSRFVLANPVFVNLSLLLIFASSLYFKPTIIERFAAVKSPDLPDAVKLYCRQVTKIWCVFFVANGLIALWTALYSSIETWTLYNGLISYVLMGVLFGAEYLVRVTRKFEES